ncbi:BrxA family protein [Haloplanus natans]|uniref:BrxA family protein n=1 Tax=Haloplanus natans TaxID=376171 RepID=UPI0006780F29|nr:BrxA family protein [Haloplanus natans]
MSNEHLDPEDETESEPEESLDPKIAHHSTYIDETKRILRTYAECESYDELEHRVVEENILNKNTDEYRTNILREVTRRHIPDKEEYTETPLMKVMSADIRSDVTDWCLYYEFAQDPFIRLVTEDFLYPEFERGTLSVQAVDIVEFIQSIQANYTDLQERSESTINEAATKYLTSLRNFGLLEGTQRKEFAVTYVPDETIAYVVYRLFEKGAKSASEIIEHEDWKLLLMNESEVQRRLRDISPEYVSYEKRGSTERLIRKYDSMEELIDAF